MSPLNDPVKHTDPFETLESRLTRAWNKMDGPAREHWLNRVDGDAEHRDRVWSELPADAQDKIIRFYLRADGPKQTEPPFVGQLVNEPPAAAAQAMFNHASSLGDQSNIVAETDSGIRTAGLNDFEQLDLGASRIRGVAGPGL